MMSPKTDSAEPARVTRIMGMSPAMLAMTGNVDERLALEASDRMHTELALVSIAVSVLGEVNR
jgi:hypothetical protein